MIKSRINGKRVFSLGVMLTLLTAAIFWQVNVKEGQAQSGGGFNTASFKVVGFNVNSLTTGVSSTPTAFYADGRILSLDDEDLGIWRVWGVKVTGQNDPGTPSSIATVNITFELSRLNGTLTAQGTIPQIVTDGLNGDNIVAITGGTGTLRGANGEATIQVKANGDFVVRLQEAKRR